LVVNIAHAVVNVTHIQKVGYSLENLAIKNVLISLFRDVAIMTYPLIIKNKSTPKNPYLKNDCKLGKYNKSGFVVIL
jgi:hypothetical protein